MVNVDSIETQFMEEAIRLAEGCNPCKPSIPKVGAIIVSAKGKTIGSGSRDSGRNKNDDHHAEQNAIVQVSDKSLLPRATIYTTLEPCTPEVRSEPLKCCTDLILQHRIRKAFVGILDPNQGVTGKGLYRLQDHGVEVQLFLHSLAQRIRAINAVFIRTQQTFGPTILSPMNGATLIGKRHTVRFKCLNPPTDANYLFCARDGLCWPQDSSFRNASQGVWEIDAHFGIEGHHTLQLITANDLGRVLIRYYQRVVGLNLDRRERLKAKFRNEELQLLGGDYNGIQMNRHKGIQIEDSVDVTIAFTPG